jgi:hypothetical protein
MLKTTVRILLVTVLLLSLSAPVAFADGPFPVPLCCPGCVCN